ncbi:precorrin-2 dehydrogenase/sirohydrochlorin ferrochelatase family protein, partial [Angustibacter peucedani]
MTSHEDPSPHLVGLRLRGRRVLVVGGGSVALRRVPALLEAGADVVLVAPLVLPALDDLAARGQLRWEPRPYRDADVDDAWFVLACTDDPAVNEAVVA